MGQESEAERAIARLSKMPPDQRVTVVMVGGATKVMTVAAALKHYGVPDKDEPRHPKAIVEKMAAKKKKVKKKK